MSHSSTLIDNCYTLETPEGVDLSVELAGPVVRTLAFVIDFAIRGIVIFVLSIIALIISISSKSEIGGAIYALAWFLIEWWYPVFFEVLRQGQTPGKKAMGIVVIHDDLTPVSFASSFIRNLLRFADFLPTAYTIGYFVMSIHPQFKRLGDIAAGTIVIYRTSEIKHNLDMLSEKAEIPPFDLTEDEQNAIVEFTARRDSISESRQEELAAIIADELPYSNADRIKRLRGVGAWLLGSRN